MICEELAWDSDFFRHRIAFLRSERLDTITLKTALAWCRAKQIECLYFLANPADEETRCLVAQAGFLHVDTRITFAQELRLGPNESMPPTLRLSRPEDVPTLKAIARHSHRDSRFYHDPHFDRERCDALYEAWIEKSCFGYAQAVLVAEDEGRPAGYLSCHIKGETGNIGLVAIDDTARGKGLGHKLVEGSLAWFGAKGIREVTVVTQARNTAALKFYESCGFLERSRREWHHLWIL